jgi:LysR family glycine cleavage system transcriptional activator
MKSYLPSFRALAALEAVVRHRNIVKAANELGVTPGAVSKQLAGLEASLGAPLFEEGHRLQPTPAAASLSQAVGYALSVVRDAWGDVSREANQRELTITANASFCIHWLVPRVLAAQEAVADRPLRVTSLHTTDNWAQASVDIAFLRHADIPPGWESQKVGREVLTLLARPDIATNIASRGIAGLTDAELLCSATRSGELENWLAAAGIGRGIRPKVSAHFYIAIEAALAGGGLIVAPLGLCHDLIAQGRLAIPFPDIRTPGAQLTGAYNKSTCSERTAERLFAWIRRELEASGALAA